MHNTTTDPDPRPPMQLDTRVARLEEMLGLREPSPLPGTAPALPTAEGRAAGRQAFAGGVRVVEVPTVDATPGLPAPFPGVTVSVTAADGTPQMLRLQVGDKFHPGPVADQITATAARSGITVERIGDEG